jgi:hypothetical protein
LSDVCKLLIPGSGIFFSDRVLICPIFLIPWKYAGG